MAPVLMYNHTTELLSSTTAAYNMNVTKPPSTDVGYYHAANCTCCTTDLGTQSSGYDYEGAMKFSVAVVMVYGIGVIGILGIYAKRKIHSQMLEKETSNFVKDMDNRRHRLEKKQQVSSIQKLVESIHGDVWKSSPSSTVESVTHTPAPRPHLKPLTLIPVGLANTETEQRRQESFDTPSSQGDDFTPFLVSKPLRRMSSLQMEREDSILETPEIEGDDEEKKIHVENFRFIVTPVDSEVWEEWENNESGNSTPASDALHNANLLETPLPFYHA